MSSRFFISSIRKARASSRRYAPMPEFCALDGRAVRRTSKQYVYVSSFVRRYQQQSACAVVVRGCKSVWLADLSRAFQSPQLQLTLSRANLPSSRPERLLE